jgi:hypothetical protein
MKAPECVKCDDLGVMPGNAVFNADICSCASGRALSKPLIADLDVTADDPAFSFGALRIDEGGMTYDGIKIVDAGRAYRTLMAVLHGQEPDKDDRPPRFPSKDTALHDMGMMLALLAHSLALHSPNDSLLREAEKVLMRYGMQAGVDYKALTARLTFPAPTGQFSTERRNDPHNPSNRANPLNQHRRRTDRDDKE